jgi:hypothetical protein
MHRIDQIGTAFTVLRAGEYRSVFGSSWMTEKLADLGTIRLSLPLVPVT